MINLQKNKCGGQDARFALIHDLKQVMSKIDGYINTPERVVLPEGQKIHLINALNLLEKHAKENDLPFTEFDCIQLRAIMQYPITISITPEQQSNFCAKHGVDFPQYIND
jgi:hypothetical protein